MGERKKSDGRGRCPECMRWVALFGDRMSRHKRGREWCMASGRTGAEHQAELDATTTDGGETIRRRSAGWRDAQGIGAPTVLTMGEGTPKGEDTTDACACGVKSWCRGCLERAWPTTVNVCTDPTPEVPRG